MAVPLPSKKTVKKYKRPQTDCKISVKTNWRRSESIDSLVRRKLKGCTLMPNYNNGSNDKSIVK
ncbi:hypothetical protein J1N35_010599 [Gossypium stocksii]|uniref:Ribosomal protein L32 n=1 Tax=Gossypium stocksii TaxID=47602 RepID=A0A9D4ACV6_9ROSI|nr:hypothetical protein J1N35_010599 [Gossypium stocksii]